MDYRSVHHQKLFGDILQDTQEDVYLGVQEVRGTRNNAQV